VHLLLIPRDPTIYFQHPLHILSTSPEFLSKCLARVESCKKLAAAELRRQFGHLSASDAPYQSALDTLMSTLPTPEPTSAQLSSLPQGRNWSEDIVAGIHTHPSMNHLHIHIFSRDMHSSWMKHKKHYLSFNSSFLVRMDEFPLEEGSERFRPGDWPKWELECWRCGVQFGNGFKKLKEHLEGEFEEWRKE
jgi:aprataxin